jgi:hypothetical protein
MYPELSDESIYRITKVLRKYLWKIW